MADLKVNTAADITSPREQSPHSVSRPLLATADLKLNHKVKTQAEGRAYLARAVISSDFMASDRKLSSLHKVSYRNAIRI